MAMTRDEFKELAYELHYRDIERIRKSSRPRWHRCRGTTCAGWKLAEISFDTFAVTNCVICSRFNDRNSVVSYVVRKLRARGVMCTALCGSNTCVACFWKLNDRRREIPPSSMSREDYAVHVTLWAMIDEADSHED